MERLSPTDKCLNCGHCFHSNCIYGWLRYKRNVNCPVCREFVTKHSALLIENIFDEEKGENGSMYIPFRNGDEIENDRENIEVEEEYDTEEEKRLYEMGILRLELDIAREHARAEEAKVKQKEVENEGLRLRLSLQNQEHKNEQVPARRVPKYAPKNQRHLF